MLCPDLEAEAAPQVVRDEGRRGLALWRETYPGLVNAGSLVVAPPRDQSELARFARLTEGHRTLEAAEIGTLEPDLAGRFSTALFFPGEAHMATPSAMAFLLDAARAAGVDIALGTAWRGEAGGRTIIDCRGMAARAELPNLRGVRGERLLIRSDDVKLARPVRLLHPRHPLYVVPWGDGRFLIGATMLESEDEGPVTVRSALELLGAAYTLHPGFAEAQILETGAGVRPAFPDNVPRAIVRDGGRRIFVNGAFRHGFLIAPVLSEAVAGYLDTGTEHALIVRE
jgi:glycine oxidase